MAGTTAGTVAWALWKASRPAQLLLILVVYAFGAKVADALGATLQPAVALAGAAALLPVAASVHYANEYADYETDALTDRTPFSGGSGALHAADLPRRLPLYAGGVTLLVGTAVAGALMVAGPLDPAGVALLGGIAVFGWQYSVGPLALASRGLGELDNAALGGLVLPAYGAAAVDGPVGRVALASVPFFLVVLLNLFATQWPDREADAATGKRTLAVRWPPSRLRATYVLVALAAGGSLLVFRGRLFPTVVVVASFVAAPLVAWGAWGYTERHVPWPTVTAMVVLVCAQLLAWCVV